MPSNKAGTFRQGFFAVALMAAVFGLAQPGEAWAKQDAIYAHPKQPKMTARLNLGKLNYPALCAVCHGKTGRGAERCPTLLHQAYPPGPHPPPLFYQPAKDGSPAHHWGFGDMPPVEGITDAQISSIVEYLRAVQQANGLF